MTPYRMHGAAIEFAALQHFLNLSRLFLPELLIPNVQAHCGSRPDSTVGG